MLFFLMVCCTQSRMDKYESEGNYDTITEKVDYLDTIQTSDDPVEDYPMSDYTPPPPPPPPLMSENTITENNIDENIKDSLNLSQQSVVVKTNLDFDEGRINYVIDDTMEVGKSYVIEVSISKNLSKIESISRVPIFKRRDNIIDTIIRIAPKMEVKLIDPTNECFTINSITSSIQPIEDRDVTIWRWNVIPLKDGNNYLTIIADVILDDVHKSMTIYDGQIHVYMKNKIWTKVANFLSKNWEFFASGILIPLSIWLFNLYILPLLKRKKGHERIRIMANINRAIAR